jgi:uncharacterized iron-regulated protein
MALAQHARDAQMARALLDAGGSSGSVLVAGAGHVRLDRGVPYYLALEQGQPSVVTLAFIEVESDTLDPSSEPTPSSNGAFDFVWYTPRANDDDP